MQEASFRNFLVNINQLPLINAGLPSSCNVNGQSDIHGICIYANMLCNKPYLTHLYYVCIHRCSQCQRLHYLLRLPVRMLFHNKLQIILIQYPPSDNLDIYITTLRTLLSII